ncbi:hypothetical protein QUA62_16390 [Microcoleus sp. MON1_C1]|uniref:hypothetical protein n=1 Tax=Microcoleus sp. MON1_C1 TaxID=2818827 RepID=UPI002FD43F68
MISSILAFCFDRLRCRADRGVVTYGMRRGEGGEGGEGGDRLFGRYVIFSGNCWNIQNSP